jgi:cutinase
VLTLGKQGWIIGNYLTPILTKGLNNDIAVQGVKYDAGILTNIGSGMADPAGVKEATRLIQLAISKCPNTIITGGGYSQGAAIMHRAIEKMSEDVKGKITAILLYGDTQYPQDGPKIKGFPQDKVKVICKSDDGVCVGGITVTPGHLSYSGSAAEGANWLIEKIKAAKSGGTGGSSSPSSDSGDSGDSGSSSPPPSPAPKGKGSFGKGGAKGGGSPKGSPKGSSLKAMSPPPAPPAEEAPSEPPARR